MNVDVETDLAMALLDIAPRLLSRLRADLPLDTEATNDPTWRAVPSPRATPGQLTLLRTLVEHRRCTMQELAEHLAVAPSTATAMVKRLVVLGYVERSRDENDWRAVWVQATPAGERAYTVFHTARLNSLRQRLASLDDEERMHIQAALPALYHLTEEQL